MLRIVCVCVVVVSVSLVVVSADRVSRLRGDGERVRFLNKEVVTLVEDHVVQVAVLKHNKQTTRLTRQERGASGEGGCFFSARRLADLVALQPDRGGRSSKPVAETAAPTQIRSECDRE